MKALAVCLGIAASGAAQAQGMQCAPYEDVKKALAEQFGEVSVGFGLAANGDVIEVYVSQAGTWTIIVVTPAGQGCGASAGSDWTFVETPWPKEGVDG